MGKIRDYHYDAVIGIGRQQTLAGLLRHRRSDHMGRRRCATRRNTQGPLCAADTVRTLESIRLRGKESQELCASVGETLLYEASSTLRLRRIERGDPTGHRANSPACQSARLPPRQGTEADISMLRNDAVPLGQYLTDIEAQ
jgi:hypothetical protein